MIKTVILTAIIGLSTLHVSAQNPMDILTKVDHNMSSETRYMESTMIVNGKRNKRTLTSIGYGRGSTDSYTEYLSPAREKGTKMLKLGDEMWIYSPATDRTILIAGHMLRQSMMGSDLSYEDMMEDRKLCEMYTPIIIGEEVFDGKNCYLLQLNTKQQDVAYHSRKLWVDKESFVPLQSELYAKSGQLLKRIISKDIKKIGSRWFPMHMNYKDIMKDGDGTDWIISVIRFDIEIPSHILSKAGLKQ